MRGTFFILAISLSMYGCSSNEPGKTIDQQELVSNDTAPNSLEYVNSYGKIALKRITDSSYQTTFTNNDGFQLDTVLKAFDEGEYAKILYIDPNDTLQKILQFGTGALAIYKHRIEVHDFTSVAWIAMKTQIPQIYEHPFFLTSQEITIKGDIHRQKRGQMLGEINLQNADMPGENSETYFEVTGTIVKEEYPIEFYSTNESPQGMFDSDTSQKHYRLTMVDPEITLPQSMVYKGTKVNDSNGNAAMAWELADSEIYLIWGKEEAWKENEVGEEIEVTACYVNQNGRSWLKNVIY